jgi:hypothetical protein
MGVGEIMTIKQVPLELKNFWIEEAKKHDRSMNREVLRVLEEERSRRESMQPKRKNIDKIMAAARHLQSIPITDHRSIEELLYGEDGLPQ